MKDTIEEDAYLTLKDRIGVFEEVVGPLQPILAEMPRIFRKLAQGEIDLIAWLEAIRGEPLTEQDYQTEGLTPSDCPLERFLRHRLRPRRCPGPRSGQCGRKLKPRQRFTPDR